MKMIQDPQLQLRAANLPNIIHSRWANSTHTKYEPAWEKWQEWCKRFPESSPLPADPFYLALYINDLVLDDCKHGALVAAANGIRYGHVIADFSNPMEDIFVKTALEGAKRIVGLNTVHRQKEPITSDMIKLIVDTYAKPKNLKNHRFVITCLLGFSGFLRTCELLEIHVKDISFDTECMKILIPKSKNDQVREGHVVYITRSSSHYCTVHWVERYLDDTNLRKTPASFVMCRLAKTKAGHKALGHMPISDTTIREEFSKLIVPIRLRLGDGAYGLHSLRSGGASCAINNGVSERLVGKHGRWKSGYSRDRYLKDDKKSRLSVTKAMGL